MTLRWSRDRVGALRLLVAGANPLLTVSVSPGTGAGHGRLIPDTARPAR